MVETLDGTQIIGIAKSNLGASAVLVMSMAICRAGAASMRIPLYEYIAYPASRPADKFADFKTFIFRSERLLAGPGGVRGAWGRATEMSNGGPKRITRLRFGLK